MAKGNAMGVWRGKKGSTVFYKLTNSRDAQKQGIRERVYEVKNPRSARQVAQRLRMLPAQRFLSVMSPIIERGYQSLKYGAQSRNEFLRNALKLDSGFPYLERGSSLILPGRYEVSKGTLQSLSLSMNDDYGVVTGLSLNGMTEQPTTVGALSTILLAANANLAAGDQLTFGMFLVPANATTLTTCRVAIVSIELDESNEETLTSVFGAAGLTCQMGGPILEIQSSVESVKVRGGVVVQSREGSSGQHLRSTQTCVIAESYMALMTSDEQYAKAVASYKGSASSNYNWPVEPIEDETTSGGEGGGGDEPEPDRP
jgi:hypothetical protein